jgi:hypothetical protein
MELYARSGFQVGTVLMDNEFEAIKNLVPILAINRIWSGHSGWGCWHTRLACTRTAGRSRRSRTVRGGDGRATDEQHYNFLSCSKLFCSDQSLTTPITTNGTWAT